MKKIVLFLVLVLFSVITIAQVDNRVKTLTITAGAPAAGWGSLNVDYSINLHYVTSTAPVTLTSSWTISASGTPTTGLTYQFYYDADVTLNGNNVTFFGTALSTEQSDAALIVTASWLGGAWAVTVVPDLSSSASGLITYPQLEITDDILNADINTSSGIEFSKMEALTASKVPVLDASGFVVSSSVGDTELGYISTLSSDAQTQINTKTTSGAIVNSDIAAGAAIVHTKMAPLTISRAPVIDASGYITSSTITAAELAYLSGATSNVQAQIDATANKSLLEGSIYIGSNTDETTAVDVKTSGNIIIGNGTSAASQAMSGDATMNSSGAVTIGANKISPSNLTAEGGKEVIAFNIGAINGVGTGVKVIIPFACNLIGIYTSVVESPITDPLVINFNDNSNSNMTGSAIPSGDLTITTAAAFGTQFVSTATANNTFAAGEYLMLDIKKSTVGTGKVLLSLEFERID